MIKKKILSFYSIVSTCCVVVVNCKDGAITLYLPQIWM